MRRKLLHIEIMNRHRLLLLCILCLFGLLVFPKTRSEGKSEDDHSTEKTSRVYLLHSDILKYDQFRNPGAQILVGNVRFRHDDVFMDCDSACFYEVDNSFDAFGNVKMIQGDTLSLTGDVLYYDGVQQLAKMRHNVVLTHRESILYTDSLDYDRIYDLGYFFEGGTLVDKDNILTSDWGEYSPVSREAVFNFNVKLENPQFTLISDTLHYNTKSSIAHIVGPSNIDNGDNHIYSELGFYDTQKKQAILLNRSLLTNKGKKMVGDSLFYDDVTGEGKAYGNVCYEDEINKNIFTGNYCYYNERTGYSEATDSALAIDYSQKDTLYLHADTFKVFTYNMETDSLYRVMHAFNKVRSYRSDIQAVCDSLVYTTKDSCMSMYRDPIVWNANQQILGEEIHVFMNASAIDSIQVLFQALTVEKIDSIHYNQIAGRKMFGYFKDGKLNNTWVVGNVFVDYYPFDSDSLMIGMNYMETTELRMFMNEGKVHKIWTPAATGTMYPLGMIPADKRYLNNFAWFDYVRPTDKTDVFRWRGKKRGTELKLSYKHEVPLQKLDQILKKNK